MNIYPNNIKLFINEKLQENINEITFLKETDCSKIYLIKGIKDYILKYNKRGDMHKEYANHMKIYNIWIGEQEKFSFRIPKLYLIDPAGKYILMEYVVNGIHLLEALRKNNKDANILFYKAGQCLYQYHYIMTKRLTGAKQNIYSFGAVKLILESKYGKEFRQRLDVFTLDTYRALVLDYSISNLLLDMNNDIYLIDFQSIDIEGPFYYDIVHFLDTTKLFSFIQSPFFYLIHKGRIRCALESFIKGYGEVINKEYLDIMKSVHRKEHIYIKTLHRYVDGLILKIIYGIMR